MSNRLGPNLTFSKEPRILSSYAIVGPMEGKGPHALDFDEILPDDVLNQKTPEKSERLILEMAIEKTLQKSSTKLDEVQFLIAGDLLNQIISSTFAAATYAAPFLGIYGACSTFAQAMGLAAALLQGDFASKVLIGTASHYQTAERQFRYPIELNVKHIATNHHTVTGAGTALLGFGEEGPRVTHATFGAVVDMGLKDPNDMGSAMAPAAFATIKQHLKDTGAAWKTMTAYRRSGQAGKENAETASKGKGSKAWIACRTEEAKFTETAKDRRRQRAACIAVMTWAMPSTSSSRPRPGASWLLPPGRFSVRSLWRRENPSPASPMP